MKLAIALFLSVWLVPAADSDSPTDDVSQIMTFSYPVNFDGIVDLWPTTRMPGAKGKAAIAREAGVIEIDVLLDDILQAPNFGGDFNTYVLWLISPDGRVENAGELVLNG